jgi:hypothetical protein
MELPPDFIHTAPKGYSYEVEQFKRNLLAIWIVNHGIFSYTDTPPRSIWGFWDSKKQQYYAPVNAKTKGKVVDINDTRAYTAMQLNLNPLEAAFI